MNYGFWEKDTDNLEQASINLIDINSAYLN